MLNNSRDHNNATLLKQLLINHTKCPDKNLWPRNEKEWGSFIDMSYRNRLVTILYHFVICKVCSQFTPVDSKNLIQKHYIETIIRYKNYQKIKNKIKQFIKNTGTQLILIKDLEKKYMRYYPPFYVPLKFDIDILGHYEDLAKFREYIAKIRYDPKGYHYGWPDKPIPQYKFSPKDKKSLFPQIEFRYKTFTIYPTKKNILASESIENFTQELWRNVNFQKDNFAIVTPEYQFIYHALIAYFEDQCRGLNNIYRVWLLSQNIRKQLERSDTKRFARKYSVINVVTFILELADKEFLSNPTNTYDRFYLWGLFQKLALQLIDLDYICRAKLPNDKDFGNWKDGYIHFLTRGLLAKDPLWRKVIFFAHPKRLLFLVWELITP